MNDSILPASVRRQFYPIALAVSALAVAYGLVSEEQAALWVALVAAFLGNGLATANRPDPHGNVDA